MSSKKIKKINKKDDSLLKYIKWINRIVCISCWCSVILAYIFFLVTGNLGKTLLFLLYTPIRYLFFDLVPDKQSKRPASLDRIIPLTIFVRYLGKRFPIPQGNFLADVAGLFLALGRAAYNGYSLLVFDTFTFFYKKKVEEDYNLKKEINFMNDDELLEKLGYQIEEEDNQESIDYLQGIYNEWEMTRANSEFNKWNFPIRRYIIAKDMRFKINEVGANIIDSPYKSSNETTEDK